MGKTPKVPNQREVTVAKEPTDKAHKYTANNLAALDEAARRLQSKGGFKLYMYLAKNLKYGEAHTDEDEFINVIKIPLKEFAQMVMDGRIQDSKTMAAILKVARIYGV